MAARQGRWLLGLTPAVAVTKQNVYVSGCRQGVRFFKTFISHLLISKVIGNKLSILHYNVVGRVHTSAPMIWK